jgi:hypothetical protein
LPRTSRPWTAVSRSSLPASARPQSDLTGGSTCSRRKDEGKATPPAMCPSWGRMLLASWKLGGAPLRLGQAGPHRRGNVGGLLVVVKAVEGWWAEEPQRSTAEAIELHARLQDRGGGPRRGDGRSRCYNASTRRRSCTAKPSSGSVARRRRRKRIGPMLRGGRWSYCGFTSATLTLARQSSLAADQGAC